jgi:hypothetical protein
MSRGLTEAEASSMIVTGFIEPLVKELPMEYAVEMNRLIELQMEGSVPSTPRSGRPPRSSMCRGAFASINRCTPCRRLAKEASTSVAPW